MTTEIPESHQSNPPLGLGCNEGLGAWVPAHERVPAEAGDEFYWLVENFTPEGQSTGLYMACQVNMTLTGDVNAARKFRRQSTAELRALDMREARRGDWRAVEHGFAAPQPAEWDQRLPA